MLKSWSCQMPRYSPLTKEREILLDNPRAAGAQNWNGATDTVILPSDDCWTVKFTSFEAFVSPTVTDIEPLHFNVRLSALVEVVTIFSPRRYSGFVLSKFADFSASEVALLDFSLTTVEFLAA
jgi:hypothetical protein